MDFKITELKLAGCSGIIDDQVESNWKGDEQNKEEGGMSPKKYSQFLGGYGLCRFPYLDLILKRI